MTESLNLVYETLNPSIWCGQSVVNLSSLNLGAGPMAENRASSCQIMQLPSPARRRHFAIFRDLHEDEPWCVGNRPPSVEKCVVVVDPRSGQGARLSRGTRKGTFTPELPETASTTLGRNPC